MASEPVDQQVAFCILPADVEPKALPSEVLVAITAFELIKSEIYISSMPTKGWYIICDEEKLLVGVLGNGSGTLYLIAYSEKNQYYIVTDGPKMMIVSESKSVSESEPASLFRPWVVEGRDPWFRANCETLTESITRSINELDRDRAIRLGLLQVRLTQSLPMSPPMSPAASPAARPAIESDGEWPPLD